MDTEQTESGRLVNKVHRNEMKGEKNYGRPRTRWKDTVRKYMGREELDWEKDVMTERWEEVEVFLAWLTGVT